MLPAPDGILGHCETAPQDSEISPASSSPGPQERNVVESCFGVSFQLDQEKVCASIAGSGNTASR